MPASTSFAPLAREGSVTFLAESNAWKWRPLTWDFDCTWDWSNDARRERLSPGPPCFRRGGRRAHTAALQRRYLDRSAAVGTGCRALAGSREPRARPRARTQWPQRLRPASVRLLGREGQERAQGPATRLPQSRGGAACGGGVFDHQRLRSVERNRRHISR